MSALVFDGAPLSDRERSIAGAVLAVSTLLMCEEHRTHEAQVAPVCNSVGELLDTRSEGTDEEKRFAQDLLDRLRAMPRRKSMLAQITEQDQ